MLEFCRICTRLKIKNERKSMFQDPPYVKDVYGNISIKGARSVMELMTNTMPNSCQILLAL